MKQIKKQIIFLKGKKTILRPLSLATDVPKLEQWINDPEIRQFIRNVLPCDRQSEENWVKSTSKNEHNVVLAIIAKPSHKFIGTMGLHNIDYINGTATSGAIIGEKKYWNKGYGQDAKMQLLAYAFLTLNLRKINSSAYRFNGRSVNYNKACGYIEEGVCKKQLYSNGKYYDEILLCVFKKDWLKLWKKYNK